MKRIFCLPFIFVLLLICQVSHASKIIARVYSVNGHETKCRIKVPDLKTKSLTCYDDHGESFKIDSDTISHIIAWHENFGEAKRFVLKYTACYQYKLKSDEAEVKPKCWLLFNITNGAVDRYVMAKQYAINKNGVLVAKSTGSGHFKGEIWYLYQRKGEAYPTLIALYRGSISNADSYLRNFGPKYFSDCPELAEKIRSKEYGGDKLGSIMDFYRDNCWNDPGKE